MKHRHPLTAALMSAALTLGIAAAIAPPALALEAPSAVAAAPTAAQSTASGWAARTYGTFSSITRSGTGDDLLTLPKAAKAAIVVARTDGESNFIIKGLDLKNRHKALLVNEIGAYSGTTVFGLEDRGAVRRLQITADGDWTVSVRSISKAKVLPTSGRGDGVFLFSRSAGAMRLTHDGESNFVVKQHTGGRYGSDLLVNEIGHYAGTVPTTGGSSVFEIAADGSWTAKRR